MLPEFDLLMPQTLPEALDMLADAPEAVPLAGGTNLIPDMRSGRNRPAVLVNLAALDELRGIRRDDGHIVVGGGATIAQLLRNPLIAAPLAEAAAVMASPLVRNRATLAGNLVDGSPAADTVPPLLALDAEVELTSKSGARWLPLDEFLLGVRHTARRPDELLTAVRWPISAPNSKAAFYKIGLRKADAIAVASVAVLVEYGDDGRCEQARIALGSVSPRVIRARAAEAALRGQSLTDEAIAEAARLAAEAINPIDDVRASAAYRRQVAGVLVRRLLTEVGGK
ncbi:MAG: xanthine dehydrogenase family protein subunit M [Chloroflexi bacterium]|nr:MAG: hypothetical protein B6I34_09295 [Anaerolineaceae bacterium 4572_32.1]RLC93727.1 MAG: xanthine dehydrogenase family protein subunit M [Chloroflexota bacterium]